MPAPPLVACICQSHSVDVCPGRCSIASVVPGSCDLVIWIMYQAEMSTPQQLILSAAWSIKIKPVFTMRPISFSRTRASTNCIYIAQWVEVLMSTRPCGFSGSIRHELQRRQHQRQRSLPIARRRRRRTVSVTSGRQISQSCRDVQRDLERERQESVWLKSRSDSYSYWDRS